MENNYGKCKETWYNRYVGFFREIKTNKGSMKRGNKKVMKELTTLKEEIDRKKIKLNNLTKRALNEDRVVRLSKELDILINQFHFLEFKETLKYGKS